MPIFRPTRLRVVESRFVLARQTTAGGVVPRRRTVRRPVKKPVVLRKRRTIPTKAAVVPPVVGVVTRRVRKVITPVKLRVVESRYTLHKEEVTPPAGVGHPWFRKVRKLLPKKVAVRQHRRMFSHGPARIVIVLGRMVGTAGVLGLNKTKLPRPRQRRPILTKFQPPPPAVGFVHRRRVGKVVSPRLLRVVESRYTLHKEDTGSPPTLGFPWFRKRRRLSPKHPAVRLHRRLFQHGRSFVTFVLGRLVVMSVPRVTAGKVLSARLRRRLTPTKFTVSPPAVGVAWPREARRTITRRRRPSDVRRNLVLTKATPPLVVGTSFSRARAKAFVGKAPTVRGVRRPAAVLTKAAAPQGKTRPTRRLRRLFIARPAVRPTRRAYVLTKFTPAPVGPSRQVFRHRPPRFPPFRWRTFRRRPTITGITVAPPVDSSGQTFSRPFTARIRRWGRFNGERSYERHITTRFRRWQRHPNTTPRSFRREKVTIQRVWRYVNVMEMPAEKRFKTKDEAITFGFDFSTFGQVLGGDSLTNPTVTLDAVSGAPTVGAASVNSGVFKDTKGGRDIPANKGVVARFSGGDPGEYTVIAGADGSPGGDHMEVVGILVVTDD